MAIRAWIYFYHFKDLYSGKIISYTISQRLQTKYILNGLKRVLAIQPKLPYRMTIQSNQGIQYQFKAYCQTLKPHPDWTSEYGLSEYELMLTSNSRG